MRHEQDVCKKLQWPFLKNNKGSAQKFLNLLQNLIRKIIAINIFF